MSATGDVNGFRAETERRFRLASPTLWPGWAIALAMAAVAAVMGAP